MNTALGVNLAEALFDSVQTGVDMLKEGRGMTRGEARRLLSVIPLQNALGISQALNVMTTNLPQTKTQAR